MLVGGWERRTVWLAALSVGAALALWKRSELLQVLSVCVAAAGVALALSPVCTALEKRGMRPMGAAGLSLGLLLLGIAVLFASFVPYLVVHSMEMVKRSLPMLGKLSVWMEHIGERYPIPVGITQNLAQSAAGWLPRITKGIARSGISFAGQAGKWAFSFVIAFYLLGERRRLSGHLLLVVPLRMREALVCALMSCKSAIAGYFSGVIKTSLFVGSATFVGLSLIGVPDALLLSVFMAILEVLPYVGPLIAAVPIVLSALSLGAGKAAASVAVVLFVQQLEGNVVSPMFTASSTSISPLFSLIAVYALGVLGGIWGILLAVPALVCLRSLFWSLGQLRNSQNWAEEMIET